MQARVLSKHMDVFGAEMQTQSPVMQRAYGRVEIGVRARDGKTALDTLVQEGCGKARIPKFGNKHCEQVVLINSSGGITGGDSLGWTVRVGESAHFTATSQACEKVYAAKAQDNPATVTTNIEIAAGGSLNWLPQETILFDGAKLRRTIHVSMAKDARLLMVEPVAFGRKAMGEAMTFGSFADHWRIHRGSELIHAEAFQIGGEAGTTVADQLTDEFAMAKNTAMATLALFASDAEAQADRLKSVANASGNVSAAVTAWNDKLIMRMAAVDSYHLRRTLIPAIAELTSGAEPMAGVPKVWAL